MDSVDNRPWREDGCGDGAGLLQDLLRAAAIRKRVENTHGGSDEYVWNLHRTTAMVERARCKLAIPIDTLRPFAARSELFMAVSLRNECPASSCLPINELGRPEHTPLGT